VTPNEEKTDASHEGSQAGTDRQFGANAADTGSTSVQVAMLTPQDQRADRAPADAPEDHHSRRGLLKLVGRRRRFLNYLQKNDLEGYRALIKELGLRR